MSEIMLKNGFGGGINALFIGSKALGLNVFRQMLKVAPETMSAFVTIDDSKDTRSALMEIMAFCNAHDKPIEIISTVKDLEVCIEKYQPDICFVVCWYTILPNRVLHSVPGGFIGIHYSMLPAYRGNSPLVWQIINGKKEVGYSVFSFTEGMDDGDIWYQESVSVAEEDYISDVMEKVENRVITFVQRHFVDIINGELQPKPQELCSTSYAGKRLPEDGNIDWHQGQARIYDFIRAQSKPYPGAFSMYQGNKVTIWRSEKFAYPIYGTPGQIGLIDKTEGNIVVVCGDNKGLLIREIELCGRTYRAAEYIKSLNYKFSHK